MVTMNEIFLIGWSVVISFLLIHTSINAQAHVYVSPQTTILSGQSSVTIDFMISNVDSLQSYIIPVLSIILYLISECCQSLFINCKIQIYFIVYCDRFGRSN
jgi:hypothetical protein